jgi:AraC-like DNA-binding protein
MIDMKNEQEMILNFASEDLNGVSVTHGYNINNAFPVHFHTTYNLGLIESGEREFFYRGITHRLKQGDIFIIQPFEPHSCKSQTQCGHNYKILSFSLSDRLFFPQLKLQNESLPTLLRTFHTLIEYERTSPKLVGLFNDIVSQLVTSASESDCEVHIDANRKRINLAKQYIENNSHIELSLKEMADIACLSESHFNRYFHKLYGLSPYAYYLACKLKKAQQVLLQEKSVTTTTYEAGFFDQSHFTRLFKKHVGVTPGKYVKHNLGNIKGDNYCEIQ